MEGRRKVTPARDIDCTSKVGETGMSMARGGNNKETRLNGTEGTC